MKSKADAALDVVREQARHCTACSLYANATQTVFGEGPASARLMFVGEQPGDQEDLAGRPFVGPAGRVLQRAFDELGIDERQVFITNAVKHFKWTPRGKRRLHKKPSDREIAACLPWLQQEIAIVQPVLIVCLGATAAQALLGRDFRVTRHRGQPFATEVGTVLATLHPSAILRITDREERAAAYQSFLTDLAPAQRAIRHPERPLPASPAAP